MSTPQMTRNGDELQALVEHGPEALRATFVRIYNEAMKLERQQFLGAEPRKHNPQRRGRANGYQAKRLHTPAGQVTVAGPKTRDHPPGESFYPASLTRGRRVTRAVAAIVAEMYFQGVSTRRVARVLQELGIESWQPMQVSRIVAELDEELAGWRNRPLGECPVLDLDARYERVRISGIVRHVAVLSAVGAQADGRRSVLGVSVALAEAERHWREFLQRLEQRGLHGVRDVVSDDHAGLRQAGRAMFPAAIWQRCQFHLAQNAIQHTPTAAIRACMGQELQEVWDAPDLATAEARLAARVTRYADVAPRLATWLEENVPEGLAVSAMPPPHRRRLRTAHPVERGVQPELKRRTQLVRVFPNVASLERLVTAILMEIDEDWITSVQPYINWRAAPPPSMENQNDENERV